MMEGEEEKVGEGTIGEEDGVLGDWGTKKGQTGRKLQMLTIGLYIRKGEVL